MSNELDLQIKKPCRGLTPHTCGKRPPKRKPISDSFDNEADNFSIGSRVNKNAKKAVRIDRRKQKIESRTYKKKTKADSLGRRYAGKADAAMVAAQGEAANNAILAQQGIVGNPVQQQQDSAGQLIGAAGGLFIDV